MSRFSGRSEWSEDGAIRSSDIAGALERSKLTLQWSIDHIDYEAILSSTDGQKFGGPYGQPRKPPEGDCELKLAIANGVSLRGWYREGSGAKQDWLITEDVDD